MGGKEQQFVNEAFDEHWIAPIGPNLNGFELDLKDFSGSDNCVALTSGTAAIHLALNILGIGQGDYVLVQSFTFCGSANPITYTGATPVYIDSERETWNMCPGALKDALKDLKRKGEIDRVKAILPVHLYGMPAKMDEIMAVSMEYGVPVVEDAAESLGSYYKDVHVGTSGKLGVFSFNGNKILTSGGGGVIVSNDSDLADEGNSLLPPQKIHIAMNIIIVR